MSENDHSGEFTTLMPAGDEPVKLYAMRWVALLQFCCIFGGNALQWVTFSLVVDESKTDYGMTTAQVNFLATDYEIVYALLAVASMVAFEKIGLRGALRIASIVNVAAAALRIVTAVCWQAYLPVVISQTLFATAMTFLLAAAPIVSARWFGEGERTLATTIGSMSNSLGLALGQLIPPLVVTPEHHDKKHWLILFCVLSAPFAIDAFLIYFVVPSGPKTPPSASESLKGTAAAAAPPIVAVVNYGGGGGGGKTAASTAFNAKHQHRSEVLESSSDDEDRADRLRRSSATSSSRRRSTRASTAALDVAEHLSAVQQLKRMFHIPAFVLLFITAGIFFGVQWSVISLITQILQPFGFEESIVGWMGFSGTTIGAFLSLPIGSWIDRHRTYKGPLFAALSVFSLAFFGMALVLYFDVPHAVPIVFALYVCSGVGQACCVPIFLEMTVEVTYPYDETLATTTIMWAGNTFCVPLMYAVPAIIGTNPTKSSGLSAINAVAVVSACAAMLVGLSNPIYKRLEYEQSLRADTDPVEADE